ncbi:MAG: SWIM zinc finger family protein [Ktedonobacterales bacterium]|nr:SWIM zinc finger family protein [Ktedonobacterales bacterium]
MGIALTAEQVVALAPDPASASAGKKLAAPRTWQGLGQNDVALWGACQGSALYQVSVDSANFTVKCTCPSRKFPCKHGLGLLLLAVANAIPVGEPPAWVVEWLAKRAATAQKSEERATRTPDPTAPPTADQLKRAAKKLSRTAQGLDELDLWMNDLIRNGLAGIEQQPLRFWDERARRLVDAQAPGLAAYLRSMHDTAGATPDWPERLLAQLGRAALLTQAFRHLDDLSPDLQEELRQIIGWNLNQDAVGTRGEQVNDEWLVVGQWVQEDEQRPHVRHQRSWLLGLATGRPALILQTSAMGAPFPEIIIPTTRFRGALRYWPGAVPVRARIEARQMEGLSTITERLPGAPTIADMLSDMAAMLARQPWQALRRLAVLRDVTPLCTENGAHWSLHDSANMVLPLAGDDHWRLLAVSGGHPVDVACEWDGERLRPLGVLAQGTYTLLGGAI